MTAFQRDFWRRKARHMQLVFFVRVGAFYELYDVRLWNFHAAELRLGRHCCRAGSSLSSPRGMIKRLMLTHAVTAIGRSIPEVHGAAGCNKRCLCFAWAFCMLEQSVIHHWHQHQKCCVALRSWMQMWAYRSASTSAASRAPTCGRYFWPLLLCTVACQRCFNAHVSEMAKCCNALIEAFV